MTLNPEPTPDPVAVVDTAPAAPEVPEPEHPVTDGPVAGAEADVKGAEANVQGTVNEVPPETEAVPSDEPVGEVESAPLSTPWVNPGQ